MKIKIRDGMVEIDGKDITQSLTEIEIRITGSGAEAKLTLLAEIDAEIEASLLSLEKAEHVRFNSLYPSTTRFLRVK
jgi:hypothetical protein